MACDACRDIKERRDVPHVIRKCAGCGRELHIVEHGKHGIGINIKEGDQFTIPAGWLKFSFNPLKGTGRFSRYGLSWFAKKVFFGQLPKGKEGIKDELAKIETDCDRVMQNSELLGELDFNNPDHLDQIIERLKENSSSAEFWASMAGIYASLVEDGLDAGDAQQVAWAMAGLERSRSLLIYKEHLEDVLLMGHSAARVIDVLKIWDANKSNSDEGFWQIKLTENAYAVSQIFAVPVVFIKDNAYVGGMNIDRKNAKLADYLYSIESSKEAILVEIKTPVSKLLGSKYRGIYRPSAELTGATIQVLDYKSHLVQSLEEATKSTEYNVKAFNPRCAIIIGDGQRELVDETRRRSFELFRSSQKDVEIVTYDEMFRKVEILANLFGLVRSKGMRVKQPTKH